MWYLPDLYSGFDIDSLCLRSGDRTKRFELTIVEARRPAEGREGNGGRRSAMQGRKSEKSGPPPITNSDQHM